MFQILIVFCSQHCAPSLNPLPKKCWFSFYVLICKLFIFDRLWCIAISPHLIKRFPAISTKLIVKKQKNFFLLLRQRKQKIGKMMTQDCLPLHYKWHPYMRIMFLWEKKSSRKPTQELTDWILFLSEKIQNLNAVFQLALESRAQIKGLWLGLGSDFQLSILDEGSRSPLLLKNKTLQSSLWEYSLLFHKEETSGAMRKSPISSAHSAWKSYTLRKFNIFESVKPGTHHDSEGAGVILCCLIQLPLK